MISQQQVVCNVTRIILEDEKYLLPRYIEIKDGRILEHDSTTPYDAKTRPGKLKTGRVVKDLGPASKEFEGKHFESISTFKRYVEVKMIHKDIFDKV